MYNIRENWRKDKYGTELETCFIILYWAQRRDWFSMNIAELEIKGETIFHRWAQNNIEGRKSEIDKLLPLFFGGLLTFMHRYFSQLFKVPLQ